MTCCAASAAVPPPPGIGADEVLQVSRPLPGGLRQTDLSVPDMHCGGCMQKVEKALAALPNVTAARANLSARRVAITWRGPAPGPFIETLERIGYKAHLFEIAAEPADKTLPRLLWALAVAGFASMNIMLLSVSVWSGAEPATRDLFHAISAFIALPAMVFSGSIFFRSAWNSLKHGRTNMDVPISIGVILAFAMSVYDTLNHGEHAYFDAATSLLFFLLIGRTLDYIMRERTRTAVTGLARLAPRGARVIGADGTQTYRPVAEIAPGMSIALAAGERVPVDCVVLAGTSEIDRSLVNGETALQAALPGVRLAAGTLNLTGPLTVEATAAAKDSFLAEMVRLMDAAESGRSGYRRIADRAASLYAPTVHLAAFLSFLGWLVLGGDLHQAVTIAVAVLIITCPCALGLAVPMVQVMAARRLFESGIMVKDGAALERLAEIDHVVFDKTGTLTLGTPTLVDPAAHDRTALAIAAALAAHSLHPHSRALAAAAPADVLVPAFEAISEKAGAGLTAHGGGTVFRLGRPDWAGVDGTNTVLTRDGVLLARFAFTDAIRPDVGRTIAGLGAHGVGLEIVSGDTPEKVAALAAEIGIPLATGAALPADKLARLGTLAAAGHKVLMVGDGLNDAPALAAAHASMAPATAADVGRNAADFVFMRPSLEAVPLALGVARQAGRLVRQNFVIAIVYNIIALPLAITGQVTPLVAAIAMSASSILVVGNALRLRLPKSAAARRHAPQRRPAPMLEAAE